MKDKKKIELRTDFLRKVRNNLRLLWISVANVRRGVNQNEQTYLLKYLKSGWKPHEDSRYKKLVEENYEIDRVLRNSICMCPSCRRTDQDMIYVRKHNSWFCTDCYKRSRRPSLMRGLARLEY